MGGSAWEAQHGRLISTQGLLQLVLISGVEQPGRLTNSRLQRLPVVPTAGLQVLLSRLTGTVSARLDLAASPVSERVFGISGPEGSPRQCRKSGAGDWGSLPRTSS